MDDRLLRAKPCKDCGEPTPVDAFPIRPDTGKPRPCYQACHVARERESHQRTRPKRLTEMAAYRDQRDPDEMKRDSRG